MKNELSVIITIGALTLVGCNPSGTNETSAPIPSSSTAPATKTRIGNIEDQVRKIVAEQLGVAADRVELGKTWQQLGADSLDCVELVMAFEEAFGMEITDEQAVTMKTVGDAVTYLTRHVKQ